MFSCQTGVKTAPIAVSSSHFIIQISAKEILQEKISDFLESLGEKGVQIISKDVKIETKCDGWVAHGELVVQEKVGTQVDTTQKED